jgi:hypothetical protein
MKSKLEDPEKKADGGRIGYSIGDSVMPNNDFMNLDSDDEEYDFSDIEGQTAFLDPISLIIGGGKLIKGAKASTLAKEFFKNKAKQKVSKTIFDKVQKKINPPKYPPKKFNNMDKSTYPSNPKVRANLSTWDLMIATANTPKEKGEIRRVLYDEYRRNGITNLSDSEQKMISKGKYQTYPKVIMPKVDPYVAPVITKPSLPIEEIIRRKAQQRLHEEQDAYDRKNGTAGIVNLMRPE